MIFFYKHQLVFPDTAQWKQRVRRTPKARRCQSAKFDLIICHFKSCIPYIPNLGFLLNPHSLEEAPVVHHLGSLFKHWDILIQPS